jgi:hypothetical protein
LRSLADYLLTRQKWKKYIVYRISLGRKKSGTGLVHRI